MPAQFTITIKPDLNRLANAFKKIDIKSFTREEVETLAFNVERFAKQITPVDTGQLRGSIGVSSLFGKDIGSVVATNKNYAVYVHEGTRYMRARPFMKQGLEFAMQNLEGKIANRLDDRITKEFKKVR